MKKKRVKKIPLPEIDGELTSGCYFTKNARKNPQTLITKIEMKQAFQTRFGYEPEEIFFGKPNGSLLYAGPITTDPVYPELLVFDKPIQPELI